MVWAAQVGNAWFLIKCDLQRGYAYCVGAPRDSLAGPTSGPPDNPSLGETNSCAGSNVNRKPVELGSTGCPQLIDEVLYNAPVDDIGRLLVGGRLERALMIYGLKCVVRPAALAAECRIFVGVHPFMLGFSLHTWLLFLSSCINKSFAGYDLARIWEFEIRGQWSLRLLNLVRALLIDH